MAKPGSFWSRLKGKVTRPVAEAAGDRHSEAKAEVRARTGHEPTDATTEVVERVARERHGDIEPPDSRP